MRNDSIMLILASAVAGAATVHARTPTLGAIGAGDASSPVGIWKAVDDKTGKAGSIYRCQFRLVGGGTTLKVRAFLGMSLFGRSQTWERER